MLFYRFLVVTFFVFSVALPHTASAQLVDDVDRFKQQFSASFSPKNPGPNEEVSVSLWSGNFNVDTAEIGWKVNGSPKDAGVGRKNFTFTTGNIGQITRVEVLIAPDGMSPFSRTFTFNPGSVDILWQAHTYTPPFYLGKSKMSKEATLTVTAIPTIIGSNGRRIDPNSLLYTWKVNDKTFPEMSGRGVFSITTKGRKLYDNDIIEVEVSDSSKTIYTKKRIEIPSSRVELAFYELNPLYGEISQNNLAKNRFTLSESEVTVIAEPFFAPLTRGRLFPAVDYEWAVNGAKINQDLASATITLRQETEARGESLISSVVTIPKTAFGRATENFYVNFGN